MMMMLLTVQLELKLDHAVEFVEQSLLTGCRVCVVGWHGNQRLLQVLNTATVILLLVYHAAQTFQRLVLGLSVSCYSKH